MPRFQHEKTRVVVNVDDVTASTLGAGWVSLGDAPAIEASNVPEPHVAASDPAEVEAPAGNASREKWAAYAAHLGIEVADDATRNEIRDNVEQLLGEDED